MFNDRENIIGALLLALCAAAGGIMLYSIVTGNELTYSGPRWLVWALGAVFFGALLFGLIQNLAGRFRSGGAPQWPDPGSGRRPWWKFWGR